MILGDVCTRRCGFCNVQTGKPTWNDPLEPMRVANQVKRMGLRHAVVTSVDRDDLPDYGAAALRRRDPLDPDAGARVQGRGADARLPRPGDAAREGDPRAARRLQPQRRDGAAAVPEGAPRLGLHALGPGAADGEGDGRRRGRHQVGPDGRPRRGASTRWSRRSRSCASTGSRSSPSASTCARPRTTCRSSATGTRTSSRRSSEAAYAMGFDVGRGGPAGPQLLPRRRVGAGSGREPRRRLTLP